MKRGGLRFVDMSEDARHRVRAWISEEAKKVAPSGFVKKEVSEYPASAAIDTPESSAANSATTEQAHVSQRAGVPDPS
jgi:hypothetical protein